MAATYRDSTSAVTSGTSITVNPSSPALTYQAGDTLVLHVFGYTSLGAPSGSDLTWTERLSKTQTRGGNTLIHKVWTAIADASITSFTIAHGVSDQIGYILTSVSDSDTTDPVDAAAINSALFNSTNQPTAPSISPAGSNSLLICAAGAYPWNNSGSSTWTPPSGMTEREDLESWDWYTLATQALSASGATGTKVFTESPALSGGDDGWIASSIAIRSASTSTVPEAVDDLSGMAGDTEVVLTWTAPADGGETITDYVVQSRESDSGPTVLFSDEFNGANNAAVLPRTGYTGYGGGGFTFYNPSADDTGIIYTMSSSDFLVRSLSGDGATGDWSIKLPIKKNTNLGNVIMGFVDVNNYWLFAQVVDENKVKLYKRVSGTFTNVGEAAFTYPTDWAEFRVDRVGNDLKCYIDGVLKVTYSMDTTEQSGFGDGYGIWAEHEANYESLELVALSNAGSWGTFSDGTSGTPGATVTGLTNDTDYDFRVAAVNSVGQGDWSNIAGPYTPVAGSTSPTQKVKIGGVFTSHAKKVKVGGVFIP